MSKCFGGLMTHLVENMVSGNARCKAFLNQLPDRLAAQVAKQQSLFSGNGREMRGAAINIIDELKAIFCDVVQKCYPRMAFGGQPGEFLDDYINSISIFSRVISVGGGDGNRSTMVELVVLGDVMRSLSCLVGKLACSSGCLPEPADWKIRWDTASRVVEGGKGCH